MKQILTLIIVVIVIFVGIMGYVIYAGYQMFKEQINPPLQNHIITTTPTTPTSVYPSKDDLIKVTNVLPNQKINSPFTITGEARGNWFFEASFPIKIVNINGQIITTTIATAQGEWMTENYVPFTATLEFNPGTSTSGKIILEKDNPSGLPENENSLIIPIQF